MKLIDLQKPIDEQSEEELLERLRQIRHNRFVERPAAKKHAAEEAEATERKASRKTVSKMDKMLSGMSVEAREALLKQLQEKLGETSENGSTEENPA